MSQYINGEFKNEINKAYHTLTRQEEYEYIRLAQQGNIKARDKIINSQLKAVSKAAHYYADNNTSAEFLMLDGTMGLITAINSFDCTRGIRFYTYAQWWICTAIKRSKEANVLVPMPEAQRKINKLAVSELDDTFDPTPEPNADNSNDGINKKDLDKLLAVVSPKDREILIMHYVHNESLKDIGESLGNISRQAVHTRINKAIKKIKTQILEEECV